MYGEKSTIRAEYEWLWAHDGNEAMIAEAGLREYVLARFGEDYGGGKEGDGSGRGTRDIAGYDGWWPGSDRGIARRMGIVNGCLIGSVGKG